MRKSKTGDGYTRGVCSYCSKLFTPLWANVNKFCSKACFQNWRKSTQVPDRFWSHIKKREDHECWEWHSPRSGKKPKRYGLFCVNYRNRSAHRVAMEMAIGRPLSPNEKVLHTCDNPCCVNPKHLYIGDLKDNSKDMMNRGRGKNQFEPGSRHRGSKLSEEDVCFIKKALQSGKRGVIVKLSKIFNVTPDAIRCIKIGKNWRNICV